MNFPNFGSETFAPSWLPLQPAYTVLSLHAFLSQHAFLYGGACMALGARGSRCAGAPRSCAAGVWSTGRLRRPAPMSVLAASPPSCLSSGVPVAPCIAYSTLLPVVCLLSLLLPIIKSKEGSSAFSR